MRLATWLSSALLMLIICFEVYVMVENGHYMRNHIVLLVSLITGSLYRNKFTWAFMILICTYGFLYTTFISSKYSDFSHVQMEITGYIHTYLINGSKIHSAFRSFILLFPVFYYLAVLTSFMTAPLRRFYSVPVAVK
jgi:hypothetical protein